MFSPQRNSPICPPNKPFLVEADASGVRLDRFLAACAPSTPIPHSGRDPRRRSAPQWRPGQGLRKPSASETRWPGRIRIRKPCTTAEAEDIPLDILYEDEALTVLHKPAGMVVHPGAGNPTGTLVSALLHHCGSLS